MYWQYNSKMGVPRENLRVLNVCQSSWNFFAPKSEQAAIHFSGTKTLLNLCTLGRSYASRPFLPFKIRRKKILQLLTVSATSFGFNHHNSIPAVEHHQTARVWSWTWNTVINRIRKQDILVVLNRLQIRLRIIISTY